MAARQYLYRLKAQVHHGSVLDLRKIVVYLGRGRCTAEAFGTTTFHATLTSAQRRRFTQWLYRHPILPDQISIQWYRIGKEADHDGT